MSSPARITHPWPDTRFDATTQAKAGAQCASSARWDLRGGPRATAVPTAILAPFLDALSTDAVERSSEWENLDVFDMLPSGASLAQRAANDRGAAFDNQAFGVIDSARSNKGDAQMPLERIATVMTADEEPLELLGGVSDDLDETGSVQIILAGRELATTTTRRLTDDRLDVVSVVVGADGETVRLDLTVTSRGDTVTVAGTVGGATLADTDVEELRANPAGVKLAGGAVPVIEFPAAARDRLTALGDAADVDGVEIAAKGKGPCARCRAKCTAQYAVSMAGCGALPPPANVICATAASALYADCYYNNCC